LIQPYPSISLFTDPSHLRIAVIGAGTMGHGIAHVASVAGHEVALADAAPGVARQALEKIRGSLAKGVERGKLSAEDAGAALERVQPFEDAQDAARSSDIVIEAVPERLELKREILRAVEQVVDADAILGTNTSSLPITRIAEFVERPARVIGLHFFNPVPAMKLVEIVRGKQTTDDVVARSRAFAVTLGKTPIVVRDTPGFATSRLGVVLGLEAIRMLEQGVASAPDIDSAMELGYNHPMGPLKLTDVVGLDVRLAIAEHLHTTFGDATYAAPTLLRRLVERGHLGRKVGRGFYQWDEKGNATPAKLD
jgi:3-hydroxybutyryl-CoA dehydrogenase